MKRAAWGLKAAPVTPAALMPFSGCVCVAVPCFSTSVVGKAKYELLSEEFLSLMPGL